MNKRKKKYVSKYIIWSIICLVISNILNTGVFAETKRKPTIRSIILAQYPYDPTKPETVELLKKYKAIGINYVTLRTYWSQIEKKPGEYDFSYIDGILDNVRKAGLKVIQRLNANSPPEWIWTYGRETRLTSQEANICAFGGKIDLGKLSVYPMIEPDGTVAYNTSIDPWDGTGNFLKCRFLATAVKHLQEKYSDVVEYINVGILEEAIWGVTAYSKDGKRIVTKTWAPTALDSYRRYLQEIYVDVAEANKIYKTNWKSFWEANPPKTYEDTKYFWDWRRWFERGMVALFMREAAIVRRSGFKVSVLGHFVGIDDREPVSPSPGMLWCGFLNPSRLELIDADLYVLGGGYIPITWRVRDGWTFNVSKNPLVLHVFEGYEILRKKPDALYIMEDWSPNPAFAEYVGLVACMLDGFQVMEGTFAYQSPKDSTPEKELEKFKNIINTFWLFDEKK